MAKTNTFTFSANTIATALDAAHAYGNAVATLRAEAVAGLKGQMSPDTVKAALLEPIAQYYGVKLVDKTRGEGKTWDKEAAKFEAAKKAHQRLAADIMGKAESSDEVEIPEELLAAAAKLAKLAAAYEGGRSLASKALASAWAK
jgi:hypothetical protein